MNAVNKLKRKDFTRIDLDLFHYYYSFMTDRFEICLEPCAGGFCVAAYDADREMIGERQCTNRDGYLESFHAMFGERRDDTWNKALEIASGLLARLE